MSRAISWTSAMDATLQVMRQAGRTCQEIAGVLDLSKNAVINRCDRLGQVTGYRFRAVKASSVGKQFGLQCQERTDEPLPVGHPIAWQTISREPWPGRDGVRI